MQGFLIALQFLTTIKLAKQTVWTAEDFGGSVRYFPLVGAVLGLIYLAAFYLTLDFPLYTRALVLVLLPILLTGGLHADGLMDTLDGVFSGRDRERMLEIMKDSRAGSFGVVGILLYLLSCYALLLDNLSLAGERLALTLYALPIISRLTMAWVIWLAPYPRPEGIGKAFKDYTNRSTIIFASLTAALLIAYLGWYALLLLLVAVPVAFLAAAYLMSKLGGCTGDCYGAILMLVELALLVACLASLSLSLAF